ncbi:4-phosphoerythronate dehydrogenase PdxB [Endozoicomonas numazuensis]|uniref:Erythronate-4-phosphate dehydrogenase n=1 Tax=Endozoicomonas numazuensis TaxID=1137799 RepID=A0A081NFJ2_9GAMM|nr:4-phosphoerythronate dehydrogenase PdxB [Endozoicomonas numazuensis]KEQ17215.1 erythronate-4-phosphate dehydrogenase [Endozoicomonas numazuensis]
MKIVADENIPLLHECFGSLAEVVALQGRDITAGDIIDADALLVRSVTKVNRALLSQASSLRFVGSCTAGVDHIDQQELNGRGISFSNAPGCNARSVVEYVLCALDILADRDGFELEKRKVGIVGHGQVGSRLYQTLDGLGVEVMACDPLCERVPDVRFESLETLIQQCDVIALHTPLTRNVEYPTHHLLDYDKLSQIKSGAILINAGRGPVIDNQALLRVLEEGLDISVVLDVWEHEPDVNLDLLARVDIGTPHIAGYSLDGKITGTEMVYKGLCQTFGLPARVRLAAITPMPALNRIAFNDSATAAQAAGMAMKSVYDLRRDDALMRRLFRMDQEARCIEFDRMRKHYCERREFSTLTVQARKCEAGVQERMKALGFHLQVS